MHGDENGCQRGFYFDVVVVSCVGCSMLCLPKYNTPELCRKYKQCAGFYNEPNTVTTTASTWHNKNKITADENTQISLLMILSIVAFFLLVILTVMAILACAKYVLQRKRTDYNSMSDVESSGSSSISDDGNSESGHEPSSGEQYGRNIPQNNSPRNKRPRGSDHIPPAKLVINVSPSLSHTRNHGCITSQQRNSAVHGNSSVDSVTEDPERDDRERDRVNVTNNPSEVVLDLRSEDSYTECYRNPSLNLRSDNEVKSRTDCPKLHTDSYLCNDDGPGGEETPGLLPCPSDYESEIYEYDLRSSSSYPDVSPASPVVSNTKHASECVMELYQLLSPILNRFQVVGCFIDSQHVEVSVTKDQDVVAMENELLREIPRELSSYLYIVQENSESESESLDLRSYSFLHPLSTSNTDN